MRNDLSRREFHKLTSAALGGLAAGTWLGLASSTEVFAQSTVSARSLGGYGAGSSSMLESMMLTSPTDSEGTKATPALGKNATVRGRGSTLKWPTIV